MEAGKIMAGNNRQRKASLTVWGYFMGHLDIGTGQWTIRNDPAWDREVCYCREEMEKYGGQPERRETRDY